MVNWSPNLQTAVSDLVCHVFVHEHFFDTFSYMPESVSLS